MPDDRNDLDDLDQTFIPNQASNKEKAEGSRETIQSEQSEMEFAERRDLAEEDLEKQRRREEGAGITNRPLAEEKAEQAALPERNTRKGRGA